MQYRHKNVGGGQIGVMNDDETDCVLLNPGDEIILSRRSEGNGIKIVEEIGYEEKPKKNKPKGDD